MSIYNRSYMRGPRPGEVRGPWALKVIMITMIGVFLLQNIFRHWLGSWFIEANFALNLETFLSGWIHTILTYAWLHSTQAALPWHLLLNMLMLWWFGRELEHRIGSQRFFESFLFFIFVGGGVWLVLQAVTGRDAIVSGASAGVFGMLYLYCRHYWHFSMGLMFLPIRFTGKQLFLVLLGFQGFFFLFAELPGTQPNVTAYSAHLGGVLGAFLYERHLLARATLWGTLRSLLVTSTSAHPPEWQSRTDTVKSKVKPRYQVNVAPSSPTKGSADLRKQVDAVLDKINEKGFGALSEEEKRLLERAKDLFDGS